MEKNTQTNKS